MLVMRIIYEVQADFWLGIYSVLRCPVMASTSFFVYFSRFANCTALVWYWWNAI
jgi:hypothetical protein